MGGVGFWYWWLEILGLSPIAKYMTGRDPMSAQWRNGGHVAVLDECPPYRNAVKKAEISGGPAGGDSESESNRRGCAGPPWGPAIKKKVRRHTAAKAGS